MLISCGNSSSSVIHPRHSLVVVGNYLAHTQGKRHQYNLGRRAAMEAKNTAPCPMIAKREEVRRSVIKIGRPGYKVRSLDERRVS
jgi:splicing factor 3A subunit 2